MAEFATNHEKRVEQFYSVGSKIRKCDYFHRKQLDEGFLNFGYWDRNTRNYLDAAKNLLKFFIENSNIKKAKKILNVCCGYGTETFEFYKRFKPKLIEGLDITKVHVDYAKNKAKALKLDKNIKFTHGDACALDYPDNSFSHIFGIEGIANFNTREKFFRESRRVLEKDGELILTDIILGRRFEKKKKFGSMMKLIIKKWRVPKENCVIEKEYVEQLKKSGLEPVFIKKIGYAVFPKYGSNVFSLKTIMTRIKQRGLINMIGLSIISYLLRYAYKRGFIEYIYVKARKAG